MTTLIRIPKLLVFITALFLLVLGAVAAEQKVTLYMAGGNVRELTVDVPSQFRAKADHYIKAYVLEYMQYWNAGVPKRPGTHEYYFDSVKYKASTPPRQIDAAAQKAAHDFFLEKSKHRRGRGEISVVFMDVTDAARNYVESLEYTGDDNVSEKVINQKMGIRGMVLKLTVPIPSQYSGRADEYAKAYGLAYMRLWNQLLDEKDETEDLGMESIYSKYDFWRYESVQPFVGGDLKKQMEKLFQEKARRAQVAKDLEAHLKARSQ